MQDDETALGRDAAKFERTATHENEAERGIACAEQGVSTRKAEILTIRKGGKQGGVHMIMVIHHGCPAALPANEQEGPVRLAVVAIVFACAATPIAAQHAHMPGHHTPGHGAAPAEPYAGMQERRIKALSAEQEADLRAGRGMALALAAELNGYPGPVHVLEHAEALRLTAAQRAAAETLRRRMLADASEIGARIVALEMDLDALFAGGTADVGRLAAITAALGAMNGRLREVHLTTHIEMREALEAPQLEAYNRLRGYRRTP